MPPRKQKPTEKDEESPNVRPKRTPKTEKTKETKEQVAGPQKGAKRKQEDGPAEPQSTGKKPKAAKPGKSSGKPLEGFVFVRTGDRIKPPIVKLVEENGGSFEKSQQTLKRSTTHLLDGAGSAVAAAHLWSGAVKAATERGLPVVVVPCDAGDGLDIETFMSWVEKASEVAEKFTKEGVNRVEYAKGYCDAFGCEPKFGTTDYHTETLTKNVLQKGGAGSLSLLKWNFLHW